MVKRNKHGRFVKSKHSHVKRHHHHRKRRGGDIIGPAQAWMKYHASTGPSMPKLPISYWAGKKGGFEGPLMGGRIRRHYR